MPYIIIYIIGILMSLLFGLLGYRFGSFWGTASVSNYSGSCIKLILFLTLLYIGVFSILKDFTILSHHSYLDYAVFLEYFYKFAHGKGMVSTLQGNAIPGGAHWFANHFTPVAYLFGFLFKYWQSFQMINWLQTALLGSSAVILYCCSKKILGSFSAACFAAALLFNPTIQYITLYEFEFLRFIIPLGIACLGIITTCKEIPWLSVIAACIACLLVREDASFFVAGIGLYLCLSRKTRWLGVGVVSISVIYLIVMLKIVMPSFRTSGPPIHVAAYWFESFGKTPEEILTNIFSNPLAFVRHILHPYKSINYIMLLVPFGFLALLAPRALLILVPSLGFLAMSGAYTHSSYLLYYIAPVFVVVVWASGLGMTVLFQMLKQNQKSWWHKNPSLYPVHQERIAFAVLCCSFSACVFFGPSPISIQFWFREFTVAPFRTTTFHISRYQVTDHDKIVREIAKLIPETASVSAEMALLNDVYQCDRIYTFPWIEGAEYVLIDKKNPRKTGIGNIPDSYDGLRINPQFYYDWIEKRKDIFQLAAQKDGIFLYRRKKNAQPYPQPMVSPP